MKNVFFYPLIVSVLFAFVSCKSGIQPADPPITYVSGEYTTYDGVKFVNVPLEGCFEVQSVSAVVVPGEEWSNIHKQINVTINVKVVKAPSMKIDRYDCGGIQLLNEDGAVLEEFRSNDYDALLQSSEGSVVTITGHSKENDSNTIQELYDQIKYVRIVNLSGGHKEGEVSNTPQEHVYLKGILNVEAVEFILNHDYGNTYRGTFYNSKLGLTMKVEGEFVDGDHFRLNSTDQKTTWTFACNYSGGEFKGTASNGHGASYDMSVKVSDEEPAYDHATSSYDDDEEDDSFSSSSSSGSEDWDAILDAYDRYVTKYISYVNKAANGDMTAMAECASLMQEANDLAEKLQNAKGELSSAQIARYTKIMNKMANAAQKLR